MTAARKTRLGLCLGAAAAALGLVVPAGAAPRQDWRWLPGGLADLAPVGLPDFSLCRSGWSRPPAQPGRPSQWTFAGPVAVADALWWLDSRAEARPLPPPEVSDSHGLVTAYPFFGRPRDDHDPANLGLLVEDLALRLNTDGRAEARALRGTEWEDLVEGLGDYVAGRRLAERYTLDSRPRPDGAWLAARAAEGAVVVALGVWEEQDGVWRRVGGHYAALAGVAPGGGSVALSDPLADQVVETGRGRMLPADPALHSCRLAPRAHDDPAVVAHDGYALAVGLADGRLFLEDYFRLGNLGEAAAFAGQNGIALPSEATGAWRGGAVQMALDAAVALVPAPDLAPSTASPTATPEPSPTPRPTDTPTPPPTASPEPTATATPRPSPTGRLWLPWLASGIIGRHPAALPGP